MNNKLSLYLSNDNTLENRKHFVAYKSCVKQLYHYWLQNSVGKKVVAMTSNFNGVVNHLHYWLVSFALHVFLYH